MEDEEYAAVFDPKGITNEIGMQLSREPWFLPLANDKDDLQRMADYDLSSLVSYRYGLDIEPDAFRADPKLRKHWLDAALDEGEYFGHYFGFGKRPYWIVHEGERIGTTGYLVRANSCETTLEFSSVYVRPGYRRQGWASRTLRHIKNVAFEAGVDRVYLHCDWGDQSALRFYLQRGFWVQSWKRDVRLYISKGKPRLRVVAEGRQATFFVEDRVVAVADNRGHRLGWQLAETVDDELRWDVEATAAVYLALIGWPIIRSDQEWQSQIRNGITDCGDFENLAQRIRRFERHLRSQDWKAPAPNPSFATLPRLVESQQLADRFEMTLSDGRCLPLPFAALYVMPTAEDPVVDGGITEDGEEFHYTLRSGKEGCQDIEEVLGLNDSPEHLQKQIDSWRNYRRMRES